ncbi:conjugal transfer protein TraF [Marinobacter sp. SS13-12]|uniref:conjugal transfer protein TraF n=1 Tax=Marinobacter sp. SS13-12 TaxID=3050451 RepID=UPI0025521215|nr:conjugal transfer protein TraF [Marinobacter sp. SS13-12]MDK8465882.1 conjugal transfer protein TraF [Marinobacter sp. SS13-12]
MKRNLALLALCLIGFSAMAVQQPDQDTQIKGYHWYEEPVKPSESEDPEKAERQPLPPPPSASEMMDMHPDDLKAMLENYLKEAVWLRTPESVLSYYRIQDVVRRKAAGFTAVSNMVMLQNPQLNGASQYPITAPGRKAELQQRASNQSKYLGNYRGQYALALFSTEECPYCSPQRNILKLVSDRTGIETTEVNINRNPSAQARFDVQVTPMVILIERNSERWMPVAVGVESAAKITANAYRAIRYLRGETTPEQFLTPEYRQGGFFDPGAPKEGAL